MVASTGVVGGDEKARREQQSEGVDIWGGVEELGICRLLLPQAPPSGLARRRRRIQRSSHLVQC